MSRLLLSRLAAAVLLVAPAAQAQLAPGDVIRFGDANGSVTRGELVAMDGISIALRVTPGETTARYPLASIFNVEVLRTGRMGIAAVGRGALVGMLGGALLGAAAGGGKQSGDMDIGRGGAAVILGVLGGVAGAVVGSVAGIVPTEDWIPVDLSRPDVRPPGSPRWHVVSVNDTVRVTVGDQLQGDAILLGAGRSELVLAGIALHDTVVVPIATIRRAEVARGVEPVNEVVGRATLIGGAAGGVIGAVSGSHRVAFAVIDAAIGAAIGAGVGSLDAIRPEPHWIPFDLATMSISPTIAR